MTLRLLTYSSLYPNAVEPRFGVFVERRIQHLVTHHDVTSVVVAPVPQVPLGNYVPLGKWKASRYERLRAVDAREVRNGLTVWHPRFPVVPGVSWRLSPHLMYFATRKLVQKLHAERKFDAIDAHYVYPDGVAATMLGKQLGIPVVMTARGNDINLFPSFRWPRRYIVDALSQCSAAIAVCNSLAERMVELGAASSKVHVVRNGVNAEQFRYVEDETLHAFRKSSGPIFVSVGYLIERKGHHISISALPLLPDATLVIVGEGECGKQLRELAVKLGVSDRVHFVGAVSPDKLPGYYSMAHATILASSSEGMANVLLESLACGTRVIATNVDGTPDIINNPAAGELMRERSPEELVRCWRQLAANPIPREATIAYAKQLTWDYTSQRQWEIFSGLQCS